MVFATEINDKDRLNYLEKSHMVVSFPGKQLTKKYSVLVLSVIALSNDVGAAPPGAPHAHDKKVEEGP